MRGRHHSRTFIVCLLLKLHGCGDPIPHIPSPSHPLQVLSTTPLTLHPDSPTFCSVLLVFLVLIQLHGCGDILFHIQALPGSVSGALPGMTGRQAADHFARCSECLSTCTHGSQHKAFKGREGGCWVWQGRALQEGHGGGPRAGCRISGSSSECLSTCKHSGRCNMMKDSSRKWLQRCSPVPCPPPPPNSSTHTPVSFTLGTIYRHTSKGALFQDIPNVLDDQLMTTFG